MRFMQTESVLQTKNRSRPAKNRFSVALFRRIQLQQAVKVLSTYIKIYQLSHLAEKNVSQFQFL